MGKALKKKQCFSFFHKGGLLFLLARSSFCSKKTFPVCCHFLSCHYLCMEIPCGSYLYPFQSVTYIFHTDRKSLNESKIYTWNHFVLLPVFSGGFWRHARLFLQPVSPAHFKMLILFVTLEVCLKVEVIQRSEF